MADAAAPSYRFGFLLGRSARMQAQAGGASEGFSWKAANEALVALAGYSSDASNKDARDLFAWATLLMGK